MATEDLNFCTHTLIHTKIFPKPFCGFVNIVVVVPDGSANVRIRLFKPEKEIIIAH